MNDSRLGPDERSYVFAVTRRILRSDDAASDATQDALLLAHRHRDQFRGDSAFRTWLYRIAVTTALGYLRKQRRTREVLAVGDQPVAWDVPDPQASPEQEAAARELEAQIAGELAHVGPGYRDVFVLRAEDCPEAEISQRLGISVANVKIRAHRVRQRLRAVLPEHEITPRRARAASRPRRDTRADSTATSRAS